MQIFEIYLPIVVSILGSIVAWIVSDVRSKSKLSFMEERVSGVKDASEKGLSSLNDRVSTLEIKIARSEQDRQEIHRLIERLDSSKASKEVVDGFRAEMAALRVDMDKRFDRIERLLEDRVSKTKR